MLSESILTSNLTFRECSLISMWNYFAAVQKEQGLYRISIGPEFTNLKCQLFDFNAASDLGCRSIKTNIIEEHHTSTAGNRIGPVAEAKSNRIDIGKVDALVGKACQVDSPFGPFIS